MDLVDESPTSRSNSAVGQHRRRSGAQRVRSAVGDIARSSLMATLAVAVVVASTVPATITPAMDVPRSRLLATYLIPPTYVPVPALQFTGARLVQVATPYITATYGVPPQPITQVGYPAALLSVTSVDQGVTALQSDVAGDPAPVIFGYSQGAEVVSVYKRAFNAQYANPAQGTVTPTPTYVVIGNPNRPNGGFSSRLSLLGLPPIGGSPGDAIPTPTETAGAVPGQITTYDFAHQYDFFADFPNRPLNPVALANAALGAILSHATYQDVSPSDAILQDKFGDTAYYLIPVPVLPLLQPLAALGVPRPIIAALDAPLRVLVEAGYDRTISPGQPSTAQFLPVANPIQTAINFVVAIPTGLDDAFQSIGGGRPFGTTPAGPYGVGGPPVTLPGNTSSTLASTNQTPSATPAVVSRAASVTLDQATPSGGDVVTTGSSDSATQSGGSPAPVKKTLVSPAAVQQPAVVEAAATPTSSVPSATQPSLAETKTEATTPAATGATSSVTKAPADRSVTGSPSNSSIQRRQGSASPALSGVTRERTPSSSTAGTTTTDHTNTAGTGAGAGTPSHTGTNR